MGQRLTESRLLAEDWQSMASREGESVFFRNAPTFGSMPRHNLQCQVVSVGFKKEGP